MLASSVLILKNPVGPIRQLLRYRPTTWLVIEVFLNAQIDNIGIIAHLVFPSIGSFLLDLHHMKLVKVK